MLEMRFCDPGDFTSEFPSDFNTMSTTGESKEITCSRSLKRLSTPSYVTAAPGTPLNFYTQWVWYRQEHDGSYTPFYPGTLQYTLEEKYFNNQGKYYFEFGNLRLMVDMKDLKQTNLDTKRSTKLIRRPVFVPSKKLKIPKMSPLLLHEAVKHVHQVPDNWSVVDRFQDFELVELESDNSDYCVVHQAFFLTMDVTKHNIVNIFRVQNPGLWDKYCSAKRAMISKDQIQEGVDESLLFHGTPTLQAVRGICANSFDFRRSGENMGTVWGKGAYFSTSAQYSHDYTGVHTPVTGDPTRFMFLARILVGQYTLGHPSYTKPPVREGLKLYDSCVNDDLFNPTIFVIFDLTQSYPEYLIQYTDASDSREEAQGQQLKQMSQLQQLPPAITSASLLARFSHHRLLSQTSSNTSSVLPSKLGHRSPASTTASTTSTTTSSQASRAPDGGLSTTSQGVSASTSKHLLSHTEPGISTSAKIQPFSRPLPLTLATPQPVSRSTKAMQFVSPPATPEPLSPPAIQPPNFPHSQHQQQCSQRQDQQKQCSLCHHQPHQSHCHLQPSNRLYFLQSQHQQQRSQ
ncbi:TCDD-inducible poly [ADP-ribose] polymerase-like [Pomacea canaliculata]|uniref:TCDD-inducible poly [ADP-ribose] polymerase-like n=1 Tax=Pomacea canaliculata TaxID=400727 RepID=UPI000D72E986|nr:TCDD-inducible poly [ADP-ribose] polymerase-like [Pomacea canaliculata]